MTPTLDADPQVWALYKEVQAYYEKGMRVPDDVTLLWCDDNWGNIRRLPTPEERNGREARGFIITSTMWATRATISGSTPIPSAKVWEQMNLALEYGADKIWIVNVGDLKPMEFPIEFFLSYGARSGAVGQGSVAGVSRACGQRANSAPSALRIAGLVTRYGRLIGRRKPELLDADTYSLLTYREADRVESEWKNLTEEAEALQGQLPPKTGTRILSWYCIA
jgi:hypothetical protein